MRRRWGSSKMPSNTLKPRLLGDSPQKNIEMDVFGLSRIVDALSELLTREQLPAGYAIGLEGEWGSGKSTLAEFVAKQIEATNDSFQVIRFNPWLVGNKQSYAPILLAEFAKQIEIYNDSRTNKILLASKKTLEQIARKVKKLGTFTAALANAANGLSFLDPTGKTKLAALGLKGAGSFLSGKPKKEKSFIELKEEITELLSVLGQEQDHPKFVVIVDDTDRLEPAQALEVLRTVREVANFPLTSYLVCLDESILAEQIETALKLKSGSKYAEKILNQIVVVPPQEPFALRRYFRRLLTDAFPEQFLVSDAASHGNLLRFQYVTDTWAEKLLKTPRDIVRVVDAIRSGWPHMPEGSDFWDYSWLQMIKLKQMKLYEFTESYLQEVGALRDNGRPSDDQATSKATELYRIMETLQWHERLYFSGIDEFLPGVKHSIFDEKERKVFNFEGGELARFEQYHRLGSPTHWRQYFSFALPSYAVPDNDIVQFRKLAIADVAKASTFLLDLIDNASDNPTNKIEVMLERLADLHEGALSVQELAGISNTLSNTMDEALLKANQSAQGFNNLWSTAVKLVKRSKSSNFQNLARNGRAVSWLAEVVREQGFAHGRPDANRAQKDRQWLDAKQLNSAVSALIRRFKSMSYDEFINSASPSDMLYMWYQLGKSEELLKYVTLNSKSNKAFLDTLDALRGYSVSGRGVTHPLSAETVARFFGDKNIKTRLEKITKAKNDVCSGQAKAILSAWK
jgi:KAP family P-loop domain